MAELKGKERIVISCVTFETVRVSDPVRIYEATRAHLIHYVSKNKPSEVYAKFYDKVCKTITEESGGKVEIIEHLEYVSNFTIMLRKVLQIIHEEKTNCGGHCDIYVNISAGTPEYSAAAAIASMMVEDVFPFSVNASDGGYQVPPEAFFDESNEPVGMIKETRPPERLPYHHIDIPERRLVDGLREFYVLTTKKTGSGAIKYQKVKAPVVVEALIEKGIWERRDRYRDDIDDKGNLVISEKTKKSDAVTYQRDFVEKWYARKWIEKVEYPKRYTITEKGRTVLETFYVPKGWKLLEKSK